MPMPDLVQLSAQFSPEQQFLCFPKQRVARGKESVSNPSPNNTRDSGETGEISCKTWLNKPPYRSELPSPGRTTFPAWGANQPHRPTVSVLPEGFCNILAALACKYLRTHVIAIL